MPKRNPKHRKQTEAPVHSGNNPDEEAANSPARSGESDAEARWLKLGDEALGNTSNQVDKKG
jgi:hypothetical protein